MEIETASFVRFLDEFNADEFKCDDDATATAAYDAGESGASTMAAIARHEIDAEANALALQFLINQCKCPASLATALTRAALVDFSETALDGSIVQNSDNSSDEIDWNTLRKAVTSRVLDTCKKWRGMTSESLEGFGADQQAVSVCAVKNGRRKMEDRHVVIPDLNLLFGIVGQPKTRFYGVYDGHAGTDAANYAAVHLHYNIAHHPDYCNGNVEKAVQEAFTITDNNFIAKSNREGLKSGSTALCCLFQESKLYVAWVGDSQAVLIRGGRNVDLMVPHKPDRQDEKERIESLGGCVMHFGTWRVNGTLAVSRAIGDVEYKPFVSGNADVTVVDLDGTEDFVILACDGLWDVLQPQESLDLVYSYLAQNPGDVENVAAYLVQVAKERGSSDNITIIVTFLRDVMEFPKDPYQSVSSELQLGRGFLSNTTNGNPFETSLNHTGFEKTSKSIESVGNEVVVNRNEFDDSVDLGQAFKNEVDIYDATSDSQDFVDFGTRTLRRNQIKPGSIEEFNREFEDDLFSSSNPFSGADKAADARYDFAATTTTTTTDVLQAEYKNPFEHNRIEDFETENIGSHIGQISNSYSVDMPLELPPELPATVVSTLSPNAEPFIMPATVPPFPADELLHEEMPTAPPVETTTSDEFGSSFTQQPEPISEVSVHHNPIEAKDYFMDDDQSFPVWQRTPSSHEDGIQGKERDFEKVINSEFLGDSRPIAAVDLLKQTEDINRGSSLMNENREKTSALGMGFAEFESSQISEDLGGFLAGSPVGEVVLETNPVYDVHYGVSGEIPVVSEDGSGIARETVDGFDTVGENKSVQSGDLLGKLETTESPVKVGSAGDADVSAYENVRTGEHGPVDDVEDDESEEGEEWKFYRMGAKEGSLQIPSHTSSTLEQTSVTTTATLSATETFTKDIDISVVKPAENVDAPAPTVSGIPEVTATTVSSKDTTVPEVQSDLKSKDRKPQTKSSTVSAAKSSTVSAAKSTTVSAAKTVPSSRSVSATTVTKRSASATVKSTNVTASSKVYQPALKKSTTTSTTTTTTTTTTTRKVPTKPAASKRPTTEATAKSATISSTAPTRKALTTTVPATRAVSSAATKAPGTSSVAVKSTAPMPIARRAAVPLTKKVIPPIPIAAKTLSPVATKTVLTGRQQTPHPAASNGLNKLVPKTAATASHRSTTSAEGSQKAPSKRETVGKPTSNTALQMDIKETKEKVNKQIMGTLKGSSAIASKPQRIVSSTKTNDRSSQNAQSKPPILSPKATTNSSLRTGRPPATATRTSPLSANKKASPKPVASSLNKNTPLKGRRQIESIANEKGTLDADSKEVDVTVSPNKVGANVEGGKNIVDESAQGGQKFNGISESNANPDSTNSDRPGDLLSTEDPLLML